MINRSPASQDQMAKAQSRLADLRAKLPEEAPPLPEDPAFLGAHATMDDLANILHRTLRVLERIDEREKQQGLWARETSETYRNAATDAYTDLGPFARKSSYLWFFVSDNDLLIQISPDGSNWSNEIRLQSGTFQDLHVICERIRIRNAIVGMVSTYQIVVFRPRLMQPENQG
jgi:hypothetical protein